MTGSTARHAPAGSGWRAARRVLGFSALYVLAAYGGRLTALDQSNLSLVWPAAGVAVVWFAAAGRRLPWPDIAALSAVTLTVNLATGASLPLCLVFVGANLAQTLLCLEILRRLAPHLWGVGGTQLFSRPGDLWRLVVAAVASTAVVAAAAPAAIWLLTGAYSWPATAVWMTRNTTSVVLIGSIGLRLAYQWQVCRARPGRPARLVRRLAERPWRAAEYLALLAVSASSYLAVFALDHELPLAFILLLVTVWAALRTSTTFVILHDLGFGTVAVLFTLAGQGPFADVASPAARALVVQLFVGMIAVVGLVLALVRDERAALLADLAAAGRAARHTAAQLRGQTDALAEANEQLTELDELKTRFIATVSHELRTPLTSILGYTELLVDDPRLPERHRRLVEVVEANSRRLMEMIESLLSFSQLEQASVRLQTRRCAVREVVERAAAAVAPQARAVTVEIDVPADLPDLPGDPVQLERVVGHVLTNAVKFSRPGGRVEVMARHDGESVTICICDRGIGIDAADLPRLFTRFFRARTAEQHAVQGSGLGLAIARAIVEAHGGSITAESAPEAGTTVRIALPLTAPRAAAPAAG